MRIRCVLIVLLAAPGCADETRDLTWEVELDDGIRADVAAVTATILRDGCDGVDERYRAVVRPAGPPPEVPRALGRGEWGFAAVATDDGCRILGRGCAAAELPGDSGDTVVTRVTAEGAGELCEPTERCEAGACVPVEEDAGPALEDGGQPDTGVDGGPDAGPDAGVDGGPGPDVGPGPDAGPGPCGRAPTPVGLVSAATRHACVIAGTAGTLYCWGDNADGQLGLGHEGTVDGPQRVSDGWMVVAAGGSHTCAVTTAGELFCWGLGGNGQLGLGASTGESTPTRVDPAAVGIWNHVAAGAAHTCGVRDGELLCWGKNSDGQLGSGDTTQRRTPQLVPSTSPGQRWAMAGLGRDHGCAVDRMGDLFCFGDNARGQIGDGTMTDARAPVRITAAGAWDVPTTGGTSHTCAIAAPDGLHCWGSNLRGQLGTGSGMASTRPALVMPDATWVSAEGLHTCAVSTGGELRCWGANTDGQLGVGDVEDRGAPEPVAPELAFRQVDAGGTFTCATTDVSVLCWGRNDTGQLGTGDREPRLTPAPVCF